MTRSMIVFMAAYAMVLVAVACTGPMRPIADTAPKSEDIEDGDYITSVLAGDTGDTLTEDGSDALAEDLSEDDLEDLAETDWTRSITQLVTEDSAVKKLLTSVAAVYDEHIPPTPVSVTLPTEPADSAGAATLRPASDDGVVTLRAALIAALLDDIGGAGPDRCVLTADDVRALGGDSPPAGPLTVLGECVERFGAEALPPEIATQINEACGEGACTEEGTGRAVWTAAGITILHNLLSEVTDAIPRLITGLIGTWEVTYVYPDGYTYVAEYTYLSDGSARYEERNDDEGTPGFGETGIVSGSWTYYWGFDPPFDPGRLAFRLTIVYDTCVQNRPKESYLGLTTLCDLWLSPANDELPAGLRFRDYAPTDDPDVFLTESGDIWHTARRQPR